ncbi:MAG: hypothetical protein KF802_06060 [Bdellovibrionaceae bacterium]|nr:hypothetical protein [Pseudobdellovibrionaceae bacterium]MBX3032485.1 hypothetical protein [Pseudobdellovibrionaceae bacterium]
MFRKITLIALAAFTAACNQGYEFDFPEQSNNFPSNVIYNNKVDVVFVVDNSSMMDQANESWRNSLPTLVNAMLKQKLDLHIAVITTSMGGSNPNGGRFMGSPRYLTSQTPNLANALVQRVAAVGNDGSDLERGLDSLAQVLGNGYQNGEGQGFLRDDALLSIIAMSTEDDKSSNLSGGLTGFSNFLDGLKGFYDDGSRRWNLSFVGILSLTGSCSTLPDIGYNEPGVRWMNLAAMSQGLTASICSGDLSSAAATIRARIAQIITDFYLSKKPDLDTLVVLVNGVSVPRSNVDGWDYDPVRNVVRFYGSAIPSADSAIRIDFKPAEAN